jgi:class 3 adenylate cyclase/tetratricopeptide (TPR) repeat protein
MDISTWLDSLGLSRYAHTFAENEIDAEVLRDLTAGDLKELGVTALGHRKKLLAAIAALEAGAAAPAAAPSPESYTPAHLAERILESRSALEGERKHVTVLFADIKGSTALIENLDPEEAAGRLTPAVSAMMAAVHRFDGTVNKVQGDGIMALFGAPLAHEDHAVRACLAALAICRAITDLAEREIDVRVGLHAGEVLVRSIRNDLSMDYDAVGPTVHLASRMEQAAEPGTVRITEAVRSLADGYIETRSLGAISVKGLQQEVQVYEVIGRTPLRTRWEARASHELTAFTGRRRELETLLAAADSAGAGQGQLVALVGEAGMGKSRLVHEFTRAPQLNGWTVRQTGALPHGTGTPYLPMGILLRAMFGVDDQDDHAAIDGKLRTELARLVTDDAPLIPVMQSLMDLPVSDTAWADLDPQIRRNHIIDGVKGLVLRSAEARPLLLVFEDLHWIDPESQRVLDALVDAMGAHRLLLVATYRPEYRHDWVRKSFYTRIRVDPLAASSTHGMLDSLIGAAAGLEQLKRLLIERTEGRPLFIEETVRSLKETGVLTEQDGKIGLEGDVREIEIPASVQDVLAARIDRLKPELKSLLQTAAVIGRHVSVGLLRAIAAVPAEDLSRRLLALQSAEFIYQVETGEDAAYLFKHALTEEVAYASLTQETRRQLHGRLVDAIELAYGGRLEEHVEELGRHALRAERWENAFTYNREAAKKAHERSAYVATIDRFEDALAALDSLPEGAARLSDKMDVRLEMRTALWPLGRHDELEKRVLEAGDLAEQAGDIARLARVHDYLTAHYWQAGDHGRAIEHGEKGIALARQADDFSVRVTSMLHLGIAFNARGEFERQVELHRQVAEELTGPVAYRHHGMAGFPAIISRGFLTWGLAELGAFDEALERARDGVEIAGDVNSAMSTVWVNDYLALACLRRGLVDRAIAIAEPNYDLCQRTEVRLLLSLTSGVLGLALVAAGRNGDAIPLLESAVQPETLGHHPEGCAYPFVWLAEAYRDAGRISAAREAATRALHIARGFGELGHQAWALFTQAEIEKAAGSPLATVTSTYQAALDLAERRKMRPLAARCRFGLGAQQLEAGKSGEGLELLRAAQDAFRQMSMTPWLDRANRLLASEA